MHLCNSRQATAAPILFACRNSASRSSLQQGGSVRDRIVFAIAGFLWLPQVSAAAGVAGPVTEVTHAPIIEHGQYRHCRAWYRECRERFGGGWRFRRCLARHGWERCVAGACTLTFAASAGSCPPAKPGLLARRRRRPRLHFVMRQHRWPPLGRQFACGNRIRAPFLANAKATARPSPHGQGLL